MKFNLILPLTLVLGFLVTNGIGSDISPLVETRFGFIQGVTETNVEGQKYDEFLGIPYAEPPIGELRFQRTRAWNRTWARPYQATSFGASCMQGNRKPTKIMSEDCLILNVYRPHVNVTSRSELLPVYYFIHGGAYRSGSADRDTGRILAPFGDLIVVSPNYRLGALGFAFGDDEEMPGNLAFYDTITALQWVKDNIQSFGGDPNQITLSGQSSGSMVASAFPIIPSLPDNLFQRGFFRSGAALSNMFIDSKHVGLNRTRLLVETVGCGAIYSSGEPLTKQHIQCLRKIDPRTLVQDYPELIALGGVDIVHFRPVYGSELLPKPINELAWDRSNGTQLDIIFGTQLDEGFKFFGNVEINSLDEAYRHLFKSLSTIKKDLTDDQFRPFFNKYFDASQTLSPFELKGKAMEFCTDFSFHCTSFMLNWIYSRRDRVHGFTNYYVYDKYGPEERPYGPQHGDDGAAFFGGTLMDSEGYSDNDRKFGKYMMELLARFVRGEPFNGWPSITLNPKSTGQVPAVKKLTLEPSVMHENKHEICLEWSKLLGYGIPVEY